VLFQSLLHNNPHGLVCRLVEYTLLPFPIVFAALAQIQLGDYTWLAHSRWRGWMLADNYIGYASLGARCRSRVLFSSIVEGQPPRTTRDQHSSVLGATVPRMKLKCLVYQLDHACSARSPKSLNIMGVPVMCQYVPWFGGCTAYVTPICLNRTHFKSKEASAGGNNNTQFADLIHQRWHEFVVVHLERQSCFLHLLELFEATLFL
jgi:hypothetical protein